MAMIQRFSPGPRLAFRGATGVEFGSNSEPSGHQLSSLTASGWTQRTTLSQHHTGASPSKWTPCCRILVLVTVLRAQFPSVRPQKQIVMGSCKPRFTSLQTVTEHYPVSTGCSTGRAADSQKVPSLCLLGLRPDLHLGTTNYAPRRPQSKHSPPTLLSGQDESVIPAESRPSASFL